MDATSHLKDPDRLSDKKFFSIITTLKADSLFRDVDLLHANGKTLNSYLEIISGRERYTEINNQDFLDGVHVESLIIYNLSLADNQQEHWHAEYLALEAHTNRESRYEGYYKTELGDKYQYPDVHEVMPNIQRYKAPGTLVSVCLLKSGVAGYAMSLDGDDFRFFMQNEFIKNMKTDKNLTERKKSIKFVIKENKLIENEDEDISKQRHPLTTVIWKALNSWEVGKGFATINSYTRRKGYERDTIFVFDERPVGSFDRNEINLAKEQIQSLFLDLNITLQDESIPIERRTYMDPIIEMSGRSQDGIFLRVTLIPYLYKSIYWLVVLDFNK